jgi:hypothetical protein
MVCSQQRHAGQRYITKEVRMSTSIDVGRPISDRLSPRNKVHSERVLSTFVGKAGRRVVVRIRRGGTRHACWYVLEGDKPAAWGRCKVCGKVRLHGPPARKKRDLCQYPGGSHLVLTAVSFTEEPGIAERIYLCKFHVGVRRRELKEDTPFPVSVP